MDKILKHWIKPSTVKLSAMTGDENHEQEDQKSTTKTAVADFDDDPATRIGEKLRLKAFAHYDIQSISAQIIRPNYPCVRVVNKPNSTTGASAASQKRNCEKEDQDQGDNRSNELLHSCPYFRNELGGEEERMVSLCRETADSSGRQRDQTFLHRPNLACGLSLLEDANEKRWRLKSCPYQRLNHEKTFVIEHRDQGAIYYRDHFYDFDHQNWFGVDEVVGPIAISIRKEKIEENNKHLFAENDAQSEESNHIRYQYRLILRSSDLSVMRGTVYEECVPGMAHSLSRHGNQSNHNAKEMFKFLIPNISQSCMRLGMEEAKEKLLKLDEQSLSSKYKVGVLFCRDGQETEEEMYNNEHSTPALEEFLTVLGERVELKAFSKYRAGLDNKTNSTGSHSVYTSFNDCEFMFHVSTLLPFTPNNKQQVLRKQHIGNDIVTIIFQESGAKAFTPQSMRSKFQHVFILVRQLEKVQPDGPTKYRVAVSRSKDVPVFGPPIAESGVYTKSKAFSQFLYSKIMNGENAAHRSDKFRSMAQRPRVELLKDLANNFVTTITLNDVSMSSSTSAKLVSSILCGSRKSLSAQDSHFIGSSIIRGAIVWRVMVHDYGQSRACECFLGISGDTFILLETPSNEVIFVMPNTSILGWGRSSSQVRIYYHQGESLSIRSKDSDVYEICEIVTRLQAVTNGCEAQEMIVQRNSAGQLGFHVTHEGIITDVECCSFAWQVGLRRNFRILQISNVPIATLDLDQIASLLKSSVTVSLTVLPPTSSNTWRPGCNLKNCSYLTATSNGLTGADCRDLTGLLERIPLFIKSNLQKLALRETDILC